jgi:hypothetical protein
VREDRTLSFLSPIHPTSGNKNSANFAFWGFCEVRIDGVLRSSQARCSDKFAPRSRKVAEKTFISPKFIADSLPPIIVRHEKARNTERRAKATKAADTWVERIIASIPVAVDESIQS